MTRKTLIQIRRDSNADWGSTNPTLAVGEPGFEIDTGVIKVGDGVTAYNELINTLQKTASVVVAATDATASEKCGADYICDGTDDQVQIQSAIDSVSSGGFVHLSSGTFVLSSAITLSSNIVLAGCGVSTTLKCADSASINIIEATALSIDFEISNLSIDGNKSGNADQSDELIQNGIYIYNCANWIIQHVKVYDCIRSGISAKGAVPGNYIQNGIISCCHTATNGYAGYALLERAEYNIINACQSNDDLYGIYVVGGNTSVLNSDIVFASYGIYFVGGSNAHSLIIEGCHINHNGRAIWGMGPHPGCIISNNTFDGNSEYAMYLFALQNSNICDNYFASNGSDIQIYSYSGTNSTGNRIMGNIFSGPSTSEYCVYEGDADCQTIVESNTFSPRNTAIVSVSGSETVVRSNYGYITENSGAAATIADGGVIAHGCDATPTYVSVVGSIAGEIVTITSIDATNITLAIKDNDGSAGTTQTIYWDAKVNL